LFNVVQWGRGDPREYELQFPLDVRDKNIVRYN
jgi:hypothetical protein